MTQRLYSRVAMDVDLLWRCTSARLHRSYPKTELLEV